MPLTFLFVSELSSEVYAVQNILEITQLHFSFKRDILIDILKFH